MMAIALYIWLAYILLLKTCWRPSSQVLKSPRIIIISHNTFSEVLKLLTKLRQNFKRSPPYRGALTNFWNLYVHDKRDKNILKHQSYCFFLHQRLRYIFSPNSMQIRYFSLFEHRMKLLCRHLLYNMLFTPFWAHPRIRYSLHCLTFCPGNLNQNSIGLYGNNQITCAFEQPISSQNFPSPRVFGKRFQRTPGDLI